MKVVAEFFMVLKAAVFKTALGGCYKPTLTELCHLHPTFSLMIVSLFLNVTNSFKMFDANEKKINYNFIIIINKIHTSCFLKNNQSYGKKIEKV